MKQSDRTARPIRVTPQYHARVWGGSRLAGGREPIGEAWAIFEGNLVETPPWTGRTLGELSAMLGDWLLGPEVTARTGLRFPLLIKLLDANDWLSVQVHPNDEQARLLEGDGQVGKTEAWHILDADPGAEIILGLREGVTGEQFMAAVTTGRTLDVIRRRPVAAGDTCFIPAGTVHALGPGLLLYEVQQTSDITYRVFDWDRPSSAGRTLHLEQAAAVVSADCGEQHICAGHPIEDGTTVLVQSEYFTLERINLSDRAFDGDTQNRSFHALTVADGRANIQTADGTAQLSRYESTVIPAAVGAYRIQAEGQASVLAAQVP